MEAVDVVAWLEKGPDRENGGHVGIGEEDHDPLENGKLGHGLIEVVEESGIAEDDREIHQGESEKGGDEEIDAFAVKGHANNNGEGDLHEAWEDGLRIHLEDGRDHESENGQHDGEG